MRLLVGGYGDVLRVGMLHSPQRDGDAMVERERAPSTGPNSGGLD